MSPGEPDEVAAGPASAEVGSTAALVLVRAATGAHAAQARSLQQRLQRLAREDAEALAAARTALDAAGDGGDVRRDFALKQLLDRAAEVPLLIAETCADVVELARELEPLVEPAHAPDVHAAGLLAAGAASAAAHLVEANLGVVEGDDRLARARRATAAL